MTDARLLGGRYEVGPVLGYGGMAEVHRGQDLRLGRTVAIKVLRTDLARDSGFQARFRREAQNAAALNHPAIVAVYDTGEDEGGRDGVAYIIMEFVEGQTLKDVQNAEGRLMPRRALEIVADVCAALDFSHRHGIIHRDIKPANVMLTSAGAVKVMDFGIARAIGSSTSTMTQTSAVIGTAQYLSPEQARGETVDARSDVYSTGCMLYELLVGQPPFTGDNPVSVAYQHVREDPIPPGERNPDVAPAMDAIVLKAMAKNPVNRYQSAGEMRADLLRAAAGQPVSATPVMPSNERTAVIGPAASGALPPRGAHYPGHAAQSGAPKKTGTTYALIALAVITVFALTAFGVSYLLRSNQGQVKVPGVLGKDTVAASTEIEDKGLRVVTKPVLSTAEQVGKVVRQFPGEGKEVDRNSEVTLDIGKGPDQTKVPDKLKGLTLAGAQQKLALAKLKAKVVEEDSAEQAGIVLEVSPEEGTAAPKDSTVTLTVSKGNLKKVPQLTGRTRNEAIAALAERDLVPKIAYVKTASAPVDTVVKQNPAQDAEVKAGSNVTITLALAPEPTASAEPSPPDESVSPSPDPSPSKSSPSPSAPASGLIRRVVPGAAG